MVKRNLRGAAMRDLFAGVGFGTGLTLAAPVLLFAGEPLPVPVPPSSAGCQEVSHPQGCTSYVAGAPAANPFTPQLPLPLGQASQHPDGAVHSAQAEIAAANLAEFGEGYVAEFGRSPQHASLQPLQPTLPVAYGAPASGSATPSMPSVPCGFSPEGSPAFPQMGAQGMPAHPAQAAQEMQPASYRSGAASQAL